MYAPDLVLAALKGLSHVAPHAHVLNLKNKAVGSSDKTLMLYEGHVHDLLNDTGKQQVMSDIKSSINAHLPTA